MGNTPTIVFQPSFYSNPQFAAQSLLGVSSANQAGIIFDVFDDMFGKASSVAKAQEYQKIADAFNRAKANGENDVALFQVSRLAELVRSTKPETWDDICASRTQLFDDNTAKKARIVLLDLSPNLKLPSIKDLRRELSRSIWRMKNISHPLSRDGKLFLSKAVKLLKNPDASDREIDNLINKFPTVEEPHLEYFKDIFQNVPDSFIFKMLWNLRVIQLTKGCTEQCSHCAYSAPRKLEQMSYITYLKIVEFIKNNHRPIKENMYRRYKNYTHSIMAGLKRGEIKRNVIKDYLSLIRSSEIMSGYRYKFLWRERGGHLLFNLIVYGEVLAGGVDAQISKSESRDLQFKLFEKYKGMIREYEDSKTSDARFDELIDFFLDKMQNSKNHILLNGKAELLAEDFSLEKLLEEHRDIAEFSEFGYREKYRKIKEDGLEIMVGGAYRYPSTEHSFSNYRDSNLSDFRDPFVKHKDGTPVDYADVYLVQAKELQIRPCVLIVVPRKSDKVGQAMLRKFKRLGIEVAVSTHFYNVAAKRDMVSFREDMKEAVKVLHPNVMFRIFKNRDDRSFVQKISDWWNGNKQVGSQYGSSKLAVPQFIKSIFEELDLDLDEIMVEDRNGKMFFPTKAFGRAKSWGSAGDYGFEEGYEIQSNGDIVMANNNGEIDLTGYNIFD